MKARRPPGWFSKKRYARALRTCVPGDQLIVLTWLDQARRDVLVVHPRGDTSRPREGVFSTRSPHRPNPIGLHRVLVVAVEGLRVQVDHLEAVARRSSTSSRCSTEDVGAVTPPPAGGLPAEARRAKAGHKRSA